MKNKKASLITIIVLLVIFIPLTIASFILKREIVIDNNPEHLFKYDGYLWFYNNDELLGKYECQTDKCDYAQTVVDDELHGILFYQVEGNKKTDIINNKYAFILDGELIHLIDVTTGNTLNNYKEIKNYYTNILDDSYILKDENDMYGVLSFYGDLKTTLSFDYDYIALSKNILDDNIIDSKFFIVKKGDTWYVVDNTNNGVSTTSEYPIIYNTSEYYINKLGNNDYKVYTFTGNELFTDYSIKRVYVEGKYLILVTDLDLLIYDDISATNVKSHSLLNTTRDVKVERKDNKLEISIDNKLVETLDI